MRMSRVRSPLLIGLLIATACGSNADSEPDAGSGTNPTAPTTEETPAAPAAAVPEALQFRAPLVGGGEIDMSTLAGKPVVLWFWAPY
jgi:hypothetical protein